MNEVNFDKTSDRFGLTSFQRYSLKVECEVLLKIGVEFDLELSAIRYSYQPEAEFIGDKFLPL